MRERETPQSPEQTAIRLVTQSDIEVLAFDLQSGSEGALDLPTCRTKTARLARVSACRQAVNLLVMAQTAAKGAGRQGVCVPDEDSWGLWHTVHPPGSPCTRQQLTVTPRHGSIWCYVSRLPGFPSLNFNPCCLSFSLTLTPAEPVALRVSRRRN